MGLIPTYDPQDYGNKPGDGPLRVGGVEASLPVTTENLPSTACKAARAQAPDLAMVRDLVKGASQVRASGRAYLPQAPGENREDFSVRLARSVFYNVLGQTVTGLTGFVFRRDIVLGDDVPEVIAGHWENIDLAGTHGDVFARDLFRDGLTAGHAAILVDYPKTGGTQTYADEVTGEVRPYWVPIKKEQILSWRTTLELGRRVLTQLVIQEDAVEPKGEYGEQDVTRYRVFRRENGMVSYQLLQILEDKRVAVLEEGTYPTQTDIPVAEFPTSGSTGLFDSTPPLLDLAYLDVTHYQVWSDQLYCIHKTCVPVLFGAGIDGTDGTTEGRGSVVIGPNSGVFTANPAAKLEFVTPAGTGLVAADTALDKLEAKLANLGLTMLAPQKRAAETAEAKRIDKSTSDSALAISARGLEDCIERALGFHAAYLKADTGGSVTVNRDYENLTLSSNQITALSQMVEKGQLTVETLWAMLLEGNVLPAEFDEDEERARLAAEAEINRQMALELAESQPKPEPELGGGEGEPVENGMGPMAEAA